MSIDMTYERRQQRQSAIRPLLAMLAIGGVLTLLGAASAQADSRFIYELCDSALPGGNVPASTFVTNPGTAYAPFQNCASPGGAIGITETGTVTTMFSYLEIAVPETPGGFVESERIAGAASNLSPGNASSHIFTDGWPPNNAGDTQRNFQIRTQPSPYFGSGGGFSIVMTCSSTCPAGAVIDAHNIAATEVDPKAPKVTAVKGSILSGGVIRGSEQSLSGSVSDQGGGLTKVWAAVNGIKVAELPAIGCQTATVANANVVGTVALSPTPCPAQLPATWTLDTEKYPFHTGTNTVAICASDFSTLNDANTGCSVPAEINVDNTCTQSSVVGGSELTAQFKGSESDRITVGSNDPATVRGALRSATGAAVAGATLCVKETVLDASRRTKGEGTIVTDALGHYSYEVKPGPNRELLVGYRHDASQIDADLRYLSHAGPELHASKQRVRNGEKVFFWGKVQPPNAEGRVVIIQASAPGSKRWLTFRKAISGTDGRFRSSYRFAHTTTATTYRFRPLVPRQGDYPRQEGAGKPVRVRVRPN